MKKRSVFAVALALMLLLSGCKKSDYDKGMQLFVDGDYEAACVIFTELGDYEDSAEMVKRCTYEMAVEQLLAGAYQQAAEQFEQLGDYKDSAERYRECMYQYAQSLVADDQLDDAMAIFTELGDYRDAAELAHGLKRIIFTEYIAEQGELVVTEPYTVVLRMSGDRIFVELKEDFEIGFSGSVLIDPEDPVTELLGTMTIGYGSHIVPIYGNAQWDISAYRPGDSLQWREVDYGDMSRLPYSDRSLLQQLTPEYFMGSGDAATIMERITDGIRKAIEESGLDVTMADLGFASYDS